MKHLVWRWIRLEKKQEKNQFVRLCRSEQTPDNKESFQKKDRGRVSYIEHMRPYLEVDDIEFQDTVPQLHFSGDSSSEDSICCMVVNAFDNEESVATTNKRIKGHKFRIKIGEMGLIFIVDSGSVAPIPPNWTT